MATAAYEPTRALPHPRRSLLPAGVLHWGIWVARRRSDPRPVRPAPVRLVPRPAAVRVRRRLHRPGLPRALCGHGLLARRMEHIPVRGRDDRAVGRGRRGRRDPRRPHRPAGPEGVLAADAAAAAPARARDRPRLDRRLGAGRLPDQHVRAAAPPRDAADHEHPRHGADRGDAAAPGRVPHLPGRALPCRLVARGRGPERRRAARARAAQHHDPDAAACAPELGDADLHARDRLPGHPAAARLAAQHPDDLHLSLPLVDERGEPVAADRQRRRDAAARRRDAAARRPQPAARRRSPVRLGRRQVLTQRPAAAARSPLAARRGDRSLPALQHPDSRCSASR